MQWKMGRGEGDVLKEGFVWRLFNVPSDALDRVRGNSRRCIEFRIRLDRIQSLVVLTMVLGVKVAVVVIQDVRSFETFLAWRAIDVPLA